MQEENNNNVTPYRASGNLNTSIGIPQMNVNDPMNMNIQSVNTIPTLNNNNNNNNTFSNPNNINIQNNSINGSVPYSNINQNNNINSSMNNEVVNNDSPVKRTFISNNTKKKKASINLGPEFKIALLIIVVLLVFIFLLPVITSLFSD